MIFPLVSVIIPAYNAEKSIERCVTSVFEQKYPNIECILINDGSVDDTDIICRKLVKLHSNIKYICTSNHGVSHARNMGLNVAEGSLVIFLDADDYLINNSIKGRVDNYVPNSMVIGNYCYDPSVGIHNRITSQTVASQDFLVDLMYSEKYGYQGFLWNKIFSMDIIQSNNLSFREDIQYNEDRLFIYEYALYCNEISIIDENLYCYVQSSDSAMASVRNKSYNHKQMSELTAFSKMLENPMTPTFVEHAIKYSCFLSSVYMLRRINGNQQYDNDIKKIKRIRNRCLLSYWISEWSFDGNIKKLKMIKRLLGK